MAIFFGFAKAFDLVEHEHILKKFIEKKYLPGWLISWLAAYLINRKQRVVVCDIKTEWKQVEAGVIQGSVLGPNRGLAALNQTFLLNRANSKRKHIETALYKSTPNDPG